MSDDPFDLLDGDDECTSHVLLYHGCDLSAASIWNPEIAPCLLCTAQRNPDGASLILIDEVLPWGRRIHFVCCGDCGTRGPWADRESDALRLWNEAYNLRRKAPLAAAEPRRWVRSVRGYWRWMRALIWSTS